MHLDLRVVCYQVVAQPTTGPVIQPKPGFGHCAPLGAGPLNAIHVDQVGNALEPQQRGKHGRVVAQGEAQIFVLGCMR